MKLSPVISWGPIVLAVLKLILAYMDWARRRELISQGYDAAMAEVAIAIARKTEAGKKIMEKVDALTDAEVDDGLRGLEPRVSENLRR